MAWALLGDSGEAFTEPREVADTAFFGLSLGGAAAGAAAGEEFNLQKSSELGFRRALGARRHAHLFRHAIHILFGHFLRWLLSRASGWNEGARAPPRDPNRHHRSSHRPSHSLPHVCEASL